VLASEVLTNDWSARATVMANVLRWIVNQDVESEVKITSDRIKTAPESALPLALVPSFVVIAVAMGLNVQLAFQSSLDCVMYLDQVVRNLFKGTVL
jgi:hypothetical protein